MLLSKHPIAATALCAITVSCSTERASYFDEGGLWVDSIVTTNPGGTVVSRAAFARDDEGRDTLAWYRTGGETTLRTTTFGIDGKVTRERVTTPHFDEVITYTADPDGQTTEILAVATTDGRETRRLTRLTLDEEGNAIASESAADDGPQTKVTSTRDGRGRETKVTRYQRAHEGDEWLPTTEQTFDYADSLKTRAAFRLHVDGRWLTMSEERYDYGPRGETLRKTETADEVTVTTTYDYDSAGNLRRAETVTSDADQKSREVTSVTTTEYGEMTKTEKTYANGELTQTTTTYYHKQPQGAPARR